jgi:protochlorophyllide reductase
MSITIALTGATAGLGRATTAALLARPEVARVVLVVRDPARGAAVAAELDPAGQRTAVVACDLASLASVDRAAAELAARGDVDVLVANAGTQLTDADHVSADGFELTFAVNHLAHWLLADRLRPARVVVVSSGTHAPEFTRKGPYPNPQWRPAAELATPGALPGGQVAYATSKLANALHVTALAAAGADAVAFDPGLMPGTGLARDFGRVPRAVWDHVLPRLIPLVPFASTPARSGAALARLAVEGAAPGSYWEVERLRPASAQARDETLAARLMTETAALVEAALGRERAIATSATAALT